ncbi:hypothetical protein [Ruminococcus flavefaciens]|uniref:Uncharacterized protein n=1 Tax=Ruminococcus flavefaciens 007c TaxID=1341157 RepID=W7UKZ6_RUMFL|nr:hypothetical protein [Ruminococcus flavefaciens]EWM54453.1 hypothetical protein RF007C_12655 [Ruminococcus flavefaciens 007c]
MCNQDIRAYALEKNVFWWQIADVLKKSEASMTRMLRHELKDTEKAMIRLIIDDLANASRTPRSESCQISGSTEERM